MAKPIENTERISTYVKPEQLELLKAKAKEKGMTVSGYIRLLIIEGTEGQGNPDRRQDKSGGKDLAEIFSGLPGAAIREV